jgi:hypothetical protein
MRQATRKEIKAMRGSRRTRICHCGQPATHAWEGEVLCEKHAIEKREKLLAEARNICGRQMDGIWSAFYNSHISAGEVDQDEKKA